MLQPEKADVSEPHALVHSRTCTCVCSAECIRHVAVDFECGRAAVAPPSSCLDSEVVAVDVSELGGKKAKQAEEQHDQGPLARSSLGGKASVVENRH